MIYKYFLGSGTSDLLVSAGLIVEGSVDQALRGKHCRWVLWCIMLWQEALMHKRLSIEMNPSQLKIVTTWKFEENVDWKQLQAFFCVCRFGNGWKYQKVSWHCLWKNKYIYGHWISFMEMANILLQNVNAYHVVNLDEYLSTRTMLPGMLAYNNRDYGKWVPDY